MVKREHICIGCLESFEGKDVYWVDRGGYYNLYCMGCIEERGFTEYKPVVKPRKKKEKVEKNETTKENKTIKKKAK